MLYRLERPRQAPGLPSDVFRRPQVVDFTSASSRDLRCSSKVYLGLSQVYVSRWSCPRTSL